MNRHPLLIAVASLLLAALSPRAAGQVGPALIFKPFTEKQYEQGVAADGGVDAFFFAEGDTDNDAGPDDFQLQLYEGAGRVRLTDAVAGRDLSFGFDVLQKTTHLFENLLDHTRQGELTLRRDIVDTFLETKDMLNDQLDAYRNGEEPDQERRDPRAVPHDQRERRHGEQAADRVEREDRATSSERQKEYQAFVGVTLSWAGAR